MFTRRKPPLTTDAYRRWLRAQRPPLTEFLRLSDVEQEALAMLGDEYMQDVALALGAVVANPQAARDGVHAARGDATAEESLVRQIAAGFAKAIAAKTPPAQKWTPPEESFAGFGERQRSETVEKNGKPKPTLFGQEAT